MNLEVLKHDIENKTVPKLKHERQEKYRLYGSDYDYVFLAEDNLLQMMSNINALERSGSGSMIEIEGNKMRAALIAAAKNDHRYAINGILLDPFEKRIVGTDGKILYCGRIKGDFEKPLILPRIVVKAAIDKVFVEELDNARVMVTQFKRNKIIIREVVELVDAQYPAYTIIVNGFMNCNLMDKVGFNMAYLSRVTEIFKNTSVIFNFYGINKGVKVTPFKDHDDEFVIVMPLAGDYK